MRTPTIDAETGTAARPEQQEGVSRKLPLRRAAGDEIEFVTIILWDSLDDVRAVAGEDYERAVVPEERRQHLIRYDATAAHYEVVART